LFCGTPLAQRIEAAEAKLIVAATEAARARGARGLVLPIAGGYACSAEDGSPMNKLVGIGFGGVPDSAAMDDVEQTLTGLGVAVQVELSSLADPEVAALLSDRGYHLVGFENVSGRLLPGDLQPVTAHGVEIRRGKRR